MSGALRFLRGRGYSVHLDVVADDHRVIGIIREYRKGYQLLGLGPKAFSRDTETLMALARARYAARKGAQRGR